MERIFGVIETKNLKKGKRASDYRDWSYTAYGSNIIVAFNEERTAVVVIQCFSKDKAGPAIAGVTDGNTEMEAIKKLGAPSDSQLQGLTKSIAYRKLRIRLTLQQEQVYVLEISTPEYMRR
jgi:hypothetical protein